MLSPQQQAREASVHRRQPDGSLAALPKEAQRATRSFSGGGGIYSTGPDYLTLIRALLLGGSIVAPASFVPKPLRSWARTKLANSQ